MRDAGKGPRWLEEGTGANGRDLHRLAGQGRGSHCGTNSTIYVFSYRTTEIGGNQAGAGREDIGGIRCYLVLVAALLARLMVSMLKRERWKKNLLHRGSGEILVGRIQLGSVFPYRSSCFCRQHGFLKGRMLIADANIHS